MNILFISHRIPWPLKDGGSIAIYNNLKGFVDAGCKVKFLATAPLKDAVDISSLPPLFRQVNMEFVSIDTGIKMLPAFLNLFSKRSYNAERFYNEKFAALVSGVVKNTSFDVVHIEGAFAAQYISTVKAVRNIPCVLREHNVEYAIWERMAAGESHGLRAWYLSLLADRLRKYEENLWNRFDLVTTVTEEDRKVISALVGTSKVYTAGVGFDLEPYLAEPASVQENTLFHLGSMDWLPNQEAVGWLLLKMWPEIKRQTSGFKLFLAGKKMPEQFLKYNGPDVQVEGEVPDAVKYMADKEIMLVPLLSGSGIRIKSIEAMAMGKVVISTGLGLSGLGVTPGVQMLEADTTDGFVAHLKYLQNNPARKAEIAGEARNFAVAHFDNKLVMLKLLAEYKKLLN